MPDLALEHNGSIRLLENMAEVYLASSIGPRSHLVFRSNSLQRLHFAIGKGECGSERKGRIERDVERAVE